MQFVLRCFRIKARSDNERAYVNAITNKGGHQSLFQSKGHYKLRRKKNETYFKLFEHHIRKEMSELKVDTLYI